MARSGQWRRLRSDYRDALRRVRELETARNVLRERLWQVGQIVVVLERDYRCVEDERDALLRENGLLREALHEERAGRA